MSTQQQLLSTGYFDPEGNPHLKVKLCGMFNPAGIELEAVIDTGFSGFLSLPLIQAFPVGLALAGTTSVQFADGTTSNKLFAVGTVLVGSVSKSGVVLLHESAAKPLLGMDFIRRFNIALVMTKTYILLFDHDWLDQAIAAGTAASAAAASPASAPAVSEPPKVDPPESV
jgi:predicted aspartyl protease